MIVTLAHVMAYVIVNGCGKQRKAVEKESNSKWKYKILK